VFAWCITQAYVAVVPQIYSPLALTFLTYINTELWIVTTLVVTQL